MAEKRTLFPTRFTSPNPEILCNVPTTSESTKPVKKKDDPLYIAYCNDIQIYGALKFKAFPISTGYFKVAKRHSCNCDAQDVVHGYINVSYDSINEMYVATISKASDELGKSGEIEKILKEAILWAKAEAAKSKTTTSINE